MNLKKAGAIVFLIALVGMGTGSILYTMYRLRHNQEYLEKSPPEKVEKAQGQTITLTESKEGKRKWVLQMKSISYSKDKNVAFLQGVKGLVYGDTQKVLVRFEAPTGEFHKHQNRIYLTKGVKMVSPQSDVTLQAPQMEWSADTDMVVAQGGVKMTKEGFGSTRAQTAEFAMDFSHIRFSGKTASIIGSTPKTGVQP